MSRRGHARPEQKRPPGSITCLVRTALQATHEACVVALPATHEAASSYQGPRLTATYLLGGRWPAVELIGSSSDGHLFIKWPLARRRVNRVLV